MTAVEIVTEIRAAGGALELDGSRIHYQIPERAAPLLDELRRHKPDVLHLLRRQSFAHLLPFLEKRVWSPAGPGRLVAIEGYATVEFETGRRMRWYDSTAIIPYASCCPRVR